jgi:hypothetical protein
VLVDTTELDDELLVLLEILVVEFVGFVKFIELEKATVVGMDELQDGYNRRDGQNNPASIREAIPKRQRSSERKSRVLFFVDSSLYIRVA